jgi:hypothetical protein
MDTKITTCATYASELKIHGGSEHSFRNGRVSLRRTWLTDLHDFKHFSVQVYHVSSTINSGNQKLERSLVRVTAGIYIILRAYVILISPSSNFRNVLKLATSPKHRLPFPRKQPHSHISWWLNTGNAVDTVSLHKTKTQEDYSKDGYRDGTGFLQASKNIRITSVTQNTSFYQFIRGYMFRL